MAAEKREARSSLLPRLPRPSGPLRYFSDIATYRALAGRRNCARPNALLRAPPGSGKVRHEYRQRRDNERTDQPLFHGDSTRHSTFRLRRRHGNLPIRHCA